MASLYFMPAMISRRTCKIKTPLESASGPVAALVAAMNRGWRAGRFDGGERFQNAVGMRRSFRHDPGIARFEQHHLPFQMQPGGPADHITNCLVIARGRELGFARLFLFPETHRN